MIWSSITEEYLYQFGFDLSYFCYLDKPCRAYYMPALILICLTTKHKLIETFYLVCYLSSWKVHDNPKLGTIGGFIWECWNDTQKELIALSLRLIDEGIAHFDELDDFDSLRRQILDILNLMSASD